MHKRMTITSDVRKSIKRRPMLSTDNVFRLRGSQDKGRLTFFLGGKGIIPKRPEKGNKKGQTSSRQSDLGLNKKGEREESRVTERQSEQAQNQNREDEANVPQTQVSFDAIQQRPGSVLFEKVEAENDPNQQRAKHIRIPALPQKTTFFDSKVQKQKQAIFRNDTSEQIRRFQAGDRGAALYKLELESEFDVAAESPAQVCSPIPVPEHGQLLSAEPPIRNGIFEANHSDDDQIEEHFRPELLETALAVEPEPKQASESDEHQLGSVPETLPANQLPSRKPVFQDDQVKTTEISDKAGRADSAETAECAPKNKTHEDGPVHSAGKRASTGNPAVGREEPFAYGAYSFGKVHHQNCRLSEVQILQRHPTASFKASDI